MEYPVETQIQACTNAVRLTACVGAHAMRCYKNYHGRTINNEPFPLVNSNYLPDDQDHGPTQMTGVNNDYNRAAHERERSERSPAETRRNVQGFGHKTKPTQTKMSVKKKERKGTNRDLLTAESGIPLSYRTGVKQARVMHT